MKYRSKLKFKKVAAAILFSEKCSMQKPHLRNRLYVLENPQKKVKQDPLCYIKFKFKMAAAAILNLSS